VAVSGRDFVLAPYKTHVYGVRIESSFVQWQFPPADRNSFPISEQRLDGLLAMIDQLDVSQQQKDDFKGLARDITVGGNSDDALKNALKGAVSDDQRQSISAFIDETRSVEKRALGDVRALYGELGISADSETAYVAAFGGWVFAIETATGQLRWLTEPKDEIIGGIAVDGDTLYFGTKGKRVYALDAATGEERWRIKLGGEVWSTPTVADGAVYVSSMDGVLHRLDRDGNEAWRFSAADAGIAGNARVDGDTVYVGAFDKKLYAVNAADGTRRWSISGGNWFWGEPAVSNGVVYAPSLDGKVYAVRADAGERVWEFDAGSPIRSAPVIADGALVVAARDGDLFKLDLETGERVGAPLIVDSTVESNLATDANGDVLLVPRDPTLYIIDATDGLTAATFELTR